MSLYPLYKMKDKQPSLPGMMNFEFDAKTQTFCVDADCFKKLRFSAGAELNVLASISGDGKSMGTGSPDQARVRLWREESSWRVGTKIKEGRERR